MRRFNLSKPGATGEVGEEAVREPNAAPPSRTRLLLLLLLLLVLAAFGAKHLIGSPFWKGVVSPERVGPPPTDQSVRLSPAPPATAPAVTLERSETTPEPEQGLSAGREPTSPGLEAKREASPVQSPRTQGSGKARPVGIAPRGHFSVQVGAMAREANAQTLKRRLKRLGYSSSIRKAETSLSQHVVLVATAGDKSEADALTERLRMEGISATLAESDGGYRVEAGRSPLLDEAIDLARDLQKRGFTTKIATETATTTLHLVRVGEFTDRSEARRTARELRGKGFPVFIVKR